MKLNVLRIGKELLTFGLSSSVGLVISNIVLATTPAKLGRVSRVMVQVGSAVISGIIGDKAAEMAINQIGETFKIRRKMIRKPKRKLGNKKVRR